MNGANPLIYICDDEPIYCKTISNICSTYMKENNIANYKIEIGYDGNDVINYKHPIDILILDIDMPHLNCIDVKERLSSLHNEVTIIFVTNHNEKMQYAFGKHVFAFITKDHLETDLPYMLDKIIADMYHYTFIDDLYNSTHVSYIEAAHNYCYLYLNSGEKILVSHRISELAEMLCEYDFVKIHRSYLVNLNYLIDYKNTYIIIKTDTTDSIQLPISVRLRNEFKNLYKIYSRKKMRYTQ